MTSAQFIPGCTSCGLSSWLNNPLFVGNSILSSTIALEEMFANLARATTAWGGGHSSQVRAVLIGQPFFSIFLLLSPKTTGIAGKIVNISKVWKFIGKLFGTLRIPIFGGNKREIGKYQEMRGNKCGNLDKKSFDENGLSHLNHQQYTFVRTSYYVYDFNWASISATGGTRVKRANSGTLT